MANNKNYPVDVEGTDIMSSLLMNLLNTFPGLKNKERITFATLDKSSGIGFFPASGAAILTERKSITGHVKQTCSYPFVVVYRSNPRVESEKLKIKEFLDAIGKWLSRQPIKIKGKVTQLAEYPQCENENRVISSIDFTQTAFMVSKYQDGVEDWEISCRVNYENEFDL